MLGAVSQDIPVSSVVAVVADHVCTMLGMISGCCNLDTTYVVILSSSLCVECSVAAYIMMYLVWPPREVRVVLIIGYMLVGAHILLASRNID